VKRSPTGVALGLAAGVLVALLGLPIVALLVRRPPLELLARLGSPVVLEALRLSLVTSGLATLLVLVLGLPTAYLLATREFRGRRAVETLVALPMVLPPTVAGLGLLLAFGRMGLLGRALGAFGIQLPFTTAAVVIAQAFMAAPFFVLSARAGIESIDRRYLEAAATLRAGEFRTIATVILPLAAPSLVSGLAMACARALGEFGATITFAGNLPGVTQTMPLAVYIALQTDLEAAIALSVILIALSFGLLLALRGAGAGLFGPRTRARRPA
jgi:molybdate transport system permease protein